MNKENNSIVADYMERFHVSKTFAKQMVIHDKIHPQQYRVFRNKRKGGSK